MSGLARRAAMAFLLAGLWLGVLLWGLAFTGAGEAWSERLAALRTLWLDAVWPLLLALATARGAWGQRVAVVTVALVIALSLGLVVSGAPLLAGGLLPVRLDALNVGLAALLLLAAAGGVLGGGAAAARGAAAPMLITLAVLVYASITAVGDAAHAGAGLAVMAASATLGLVLPVVWLHAAGRSPVWQAMASLPAALILAAYAFWGDADAGRAWLVQAVLTWGAWPVAGLAAVLGWRKASSALRAASGLWLAGLALAIASAVTGMGGFETARLLAQASIVWLVMPLSGRAGHGVRVAAAGLAGAVLLMPWQPALAVVVQGLSYGALVLLLTGRVWGDAPGRILADPRVRTGAAVLASVAAIGVGVALWPDAAARRAAQDPVAQAAGHAVAARQQEIRTRFEQAVAMLHAGQYAFAVKALHRVMELDPTLPEAHVNMGFALLGQGDAAGAQRFFETATELRGDQLNAYYGLALALEAQERLGAAAGALRTYLHLAAAADPFREKGAQALARIEGRLAEARRGSPPAKAGENG